MCNSYHCLILVFEVMNCLHKLERVRNGERDPPAIINVVLLKVIDSDGSFVPKRESS